MKKYYYDCPLKALYMNKEFGVKLCEAHGANHADKYYQLDTQTICELITGSFEDFRGIEQIYVSEESNHIFEPKDWDDESSEYAILKNGQISEIIMRDGKHFFMPKVIEE